MGIFSIFVIFVFAVYFKLIGMETAVIVGVLCLLLVPSIQSEGMNERTDLMAWFEPEGYGTHNSMFNPEIKPLMYKYAYQPMDDE